MGAITGPIMAAGTYIIGYWHMKKKILIAVQV
jgi:hypothetical protein